jgi:5-methylcytosine-specific restriction endonuclease McrA
MNAVLVLNQDYTPLTVCSVQRAFMLMFLNKAELLMSRKTKKLRSVSKSFPYPSVIKINHYINIPYKGVVMSRHNIFKRDDGKCQYCGSKKKLTIDHIIPKSKGGQSTWFNLVTACNKCNSKKGNSNIEKLGMQLIQTPVKPSYTLMLRKSYHTYIEDWDTYLKLKKATV